MKTYSMKASEVDKKHYVLTQTAWFLEEWLRDCDRLAENKSTFTPSMDCGDNAIVIMPKRSCLPAKR